mmetsp:Transcript_1011/g.1083  ORF Transcript_1011/g.1083 Transcript_1011/m.1083 type:complete len:406 (+) Transcript_1011:216-1433(+)
MESEKRALDSILQKSVSHLIAQNRFPTLENLQALILSPESKFSNGSSNFDFTEAASFKTLLEINQKTSIFICSFMACRPILSLLSLEAELCSFLFSYGIAPFQPKQRLSNPEEIDIDDDAGTTEKNEQGSDPVECTSQTLVPRRRPCNFEHFGLGSLVRHPLLCDIFVAQSPIALSEEQVLMHLNSFPGSIDMFEFFLLKHYGATSVTKDLNVSLDLNGVNQHYQALRQIGEESRKKLLVANDLMVERSMPYISSTGISKSVSNLELSASIPERMPKPWDLKDVGRWGENLVYEYLKNMNPKATVIWMNKDGETKAPYDVKLMLAGENSLRQTRFVEVKTTRFKDKNVFELSYNEFMFMGDQGGRINYDIYRVYNAGDASNVYIEIVENVFEKVKNHMVRLCLAV